MDGPAIHDIRGVAVMLDEDVAPPFGFTTGRLNEAVKRNVARFGERFAFQLTAQEWARLKSQIAIAKPGRGGRRSPPWVYTEHGVVMAATVLRSEEAIAASRLIVDVFVASRKMLRIEEPGRNAPTILSGVDLKGALPDTDRSIAAQAQQMIGRILDTIANAEENATVRQEGQAIIGKSLNAIKAHLDAKGIQNEKTLTEIRRQLKEIEAIDADVIAKSIEADHRRLAYLAKQLMLVIGLQDYVETGGAEGFLDILRQLSDG